jgi:hypothetical protein
MDELRAERPGFDSRQCEILLFPRVFRPVLRPTQPLIQWVRGDLSPEVKLPGREAEHLPAYSAEVKNGGVIPPLRRTSSWPGAYLSTRTTLPFLYLHVSY